MYNDDQHVCFGVVFFFHVADIHGCQILGQSESDWSQGGQILELFQIRFTFGATLTNIWPKSGEFADQVSALAPTRSPSAAIFVWVRVRVTVRVVWGHVSFCLDLFKSVL